MDNSLSTRIGEQLRARGLTLATAESCTGGLVAHLLTNIPGSSDYFLGGVVAYADEIKSSVLSVPPGLLAQYGAVSRETVIAMAQGACQCFGTHLAVSVSGIAGPGGGTPEKPVGTTWIGLAAPSVTWARKFTWDGDREQNKASSAQAALQIVLDYLLGNLAP